MKQNKNLITAMIIAVMLVFQFSSNAGLVSADDGTVADGTNPIQVNTSSSTDETSESQDSIDLGNDFSDLINVLNNENGEVTDDSGIALPMASVETINVLTGDPFFADPIDPTVARVFLSNCSGWVLPAGFTSGTCTESDKPVQSAINAAISGTTIFIEAGNYSEDVSISTSNLTLIGLGGNAVIDQLSLFADVNDLSQNIYSPLVHVYRGGNLNDAYNLLLAGGKIKIHAKDKKPVQLSGSSSPTIPQGNIDTIPVTGGETVNYSCLKPTELILPSGANAVSTNILCGYSGTFSSFSLENLPGALEEKYTFVTGVSIVLRDKGKPALVLPGSTRLVIQLPVPDSVDLGRMTVLAWDQHLNNGAGAWVPLIGIETSNGSISFRVNHPGYFILVIG